MEQTNTNMDIAVEQMLNRWEGLPFATLVTKLRAAGFAPSLEEVQSILCNMAKEGCLLIGEGNRLRYHEDAHVLPRYDLFPFVLVYDPPYTIGTLTKDFTLTQDEEYPCPVHAPAETDSADDDEQQEERDPWSDFQGGRVMGMFGHWSDAWRAANTDFIGDPNCGRTIYRWNGTAFELDSYAAQATPVEIPPAPVRTETENPETENNSTYSASAEKAREDEKINAEVDAVVLAVRESMHKTVYKKLRDEADDNVIKMSFSVEVDLDAEAVTSKMSGSVKVSAKGKASIKDPAQGELPLDGDEDDADDDDD